MALNKTALERQKEAQEEFNLTQRLFNGSLLDDSESHLGFRAVKDPSEKHQNEK